METPHNGLAFRRERCLLSLSLFSICCCGAAPGLNPSTSLRSCSSRSFSPLLSSLSFTLVFNSAPDGFMTVGPVALAAVVAASALFGPAPVATPCCFPSWGHVRPPSALADAAFPGVGRRRALWRRAATAPVAYCCRRIGRAPLPSAAPGRSTATMPLVACCTLHARAFLEFGNTAALCRHAASCRDYSAARPLASPTAIE